MVEKMENESGMSKITYFLLLKRFSGSSKWLEIGNFCFKSSLCVFLCMSGYEQYFIMEFIK